MFLASLSCKVKSKRKKSHSHKYIQIVQCFLPVSPGPWVLLSPVWMCGKSVLTFLCPSPTYTWHCPELGHPGLTARSAGTTKHWNMVVRCPSIVKYISDVGGWKRKKKIVKVSLINLCRLWIKIVSIDIAFNKNYPSAVNCFFLLY